MAERIDNDSLFLRNAGDNNKTDPNFLGKDDFLKLLITQLQNQSPENPMDDKQFISQMATFSTLEQMTNMNQLLETYLKNQSISSDLQDAQLVGKHVTWQKREEDGGGTGEGTVQSVHFKNGNVRFEMEDGTLIDRNQIIEIGLPIQKSEAGSQKPDQMHIQGR